MQNTFRKNSLLLAALLATVAPAMAQTTVSAPNVTVYGRIEMGLEFNTNGSTNRTSIENFGSRLGFKGEKALGSDLSGVFQIETGVAPDDTTQSKTLASRNSFVGLSSKTGGTLLMGTYDMPLKAMEGTTAPMWGEGDLQELIIHGKGSKSATNTAGAGAFDNVHTRRTNVLNYTSPKFADIVAKLAYSPDEAAKAAATVAPLTPAYAQPMVGASVYWDNGVFNGGYGYQSLDNAIAPTATTSGYALTANKVVAGAKMDNWSVGIAMSTIDNGNNKKTTNLTLSGTYALGKTLLKASYGTSSESASGAADDLNAFALEADYAMDKDFTVYTYFAQINNGSKAKGTFAAADNFPAVVNAGDTPKALGLGIRYNF